MEDTGSNRDDGYGEADKDRLIEELRESVRARDEFVAIAAHELRNPMTPILMQVGILLAAAKDPNRCRPELMVPRLTQLEMAVEEFVRRSTALLDVSRIAAGNVRIELTEVNLSALIRGVLSRTAPAAQRARCQLDDDLQEGVVGMWDPLALEQVVENLLTNATKFGAGQPVTVILRSDGRRAQLIIRDRGIGISEEDRARIFQRFERAVTRREHGGFGIGLWLANQLIIAMKGAIAIESASGEGTTFTVTLPLDSAPRQEFGA
jgi:two-component system, OmpR family, sensor kinase